MYRGFRLFVKLHRQAFLNVNLISGYFTEVDFAIAACTA